MAAALSPAGRTPVRCVPSMATLSAVRRNPPLAATYRRLLDAGELPTVALIACERTLLVLLTAIVAHGAPWEPDFAQHP